MSITLDSIKDKMIGRTFGKLTILSYLGRSERGDNLWKAKCECGTVVTGRTSNVDKPNAGCPKCKREDGPRAREWKTYLLGRVFGRLKVIAHAGTGEYQRNQWLCLCSCGNQTVVISSNLLTGVTQSCGCYARERAGINRTTHGLSKHPLYAVWYAMKDRCLNPKHPAYYRYGGRKDNRICVCDEWLSGFLPFYEWAIHNGYQEGLTIERQDNDGNYEPSNCKWATRSEQNQNTSLTKLSSEEVLTIRSDKRTNREIAVDYDVNESTISRIKAWDTWSNVGQREIDYSW